MTSKPSHPLLPAEVGHAEPHLRRCPDRSALGETPAEPRDESGYIHEVTLTRPLALSLVRHTCLVRRLLQPLWLARGHVLAIRRMVQPRVSRGLRRLNLPAYSPLLYSSPHQARSSKVQCPWNKRVKVSANSTSTIVVGAARINNTGSGSHHHPSILAGG
ncbi:hypothetical protein BO78DRAFT_218098 [Aspergillus sclerotiicarbonarius CBS 121057]|uniref:Uncharacterized protein n=1 Tax=Aspergillus sclerotiicarbonarius (strain CBS 121057 / IBT 28362) TaxID=1448318 RepID=A0A319ELW7_ASPSB|nr:hypothetical protein BO78DRAFT_218098 [Aspergillus sclerotiicarbonarius CBS 121057]